MGKTAKKIVEENPGLAANVVELFEKVVAKADEDSKKAELPINPATGNKLIIDDEAVQGELPLTMEQEVAAAEARTLTDAIPVTEATDLALDAPASPAPIQGVPTDDIRAPLTMVTILPKEPRKPWLQVASATLQPMLNRIGKTFSEGWRALSNAVKLGTGKLVVGLIAALYAVVMIPAGICYCVGWFLRGCVNSFKHGWSHEPIMSETTAFTVAPVITDKE
jgi:hypothetical protein